MNFKPQFITNLGMVDFSSCYICSTQYTSIEANFCQKCGSPVQKIPQTTEGDSPQAPTNVGNRVEENEAFEVKETSQNSQTPVNPAFSQKTEESTMLHPNLETAGVANDTNYQENLKKRENSSQLSSPTTNDAYRQPQQNYGQPQFQYGQSSGQTQQQGYGAGNPFTYPGQVPQRPYVPPAAFRTRIEPLKDVSLFERKQLLAMGTFIIVLYCAHLLRHLLYFNSFPGLDDFIFSFVFYVIFIPLCFFPLNYIYHQNGLKENFHANKFDYVFSLVLSIFFLSTVSFRMKINTEESTLPTEIKTVVSKNFSSSPATFSKGEYIGKKVLPKAYRIRFAVLLILGYFILFLGLGGALAISPAVQLFLGFVGMFTLLEIAPGIGRNRETILGNANIIGLILVLLAFILVVFGVASNVFQAATMFISG